MFAMVIAWTSCRTNGRVVGDLRCLNTRAMSLFWDMLKILGWFICVIENKWWIRCLLGTLWSLSFWLVDAFFASQFWNALENCCQVMATFVSFLCAWIRWFPIILNTPTRSNHIAVTSYGCNGSQQASYKENITALHHWSVAADTTGAHQIFHKWQVMQKELSCHAASV